MNTQFDENIIWLDNMTTEDLKFAVGSARYILEDLSAKRLSNITGLDEGVISAALDNIFLKEGYVRPSRKR